MLSAKKLHCRRGGRTVLASLSFELHPGQALELRGTNGSGKTTLLRALAGLAPLSDGKLIWKDRDLRPGDSDYARHMAYLGHLNGLSADLSVSENLRFSQQLSDAGETSRLPAALQSWGLAAWADRPVRFLSQGQCRRLALARLGLGHRTLWLLDEPCAALDSAGEALFDAQLSAHLEAGGMAVVATHRSLSIAATSLQCVDLDARPRAAAEGTLAAC